MFEVKFEVDLRNPAHVAALKDFITILSEEKRIPQGINVTEVRQDPKQDEPKQSRRSRKQEQATNGVENHEEAQGLEVPANEDFDTVLKSSIKIEDVRAVLSKKVNDHRAEIKTELTRLGAANVTSLEEKHYPEFMEFLKEL